MPFLCIKNITQARVYLPHFLFIFYFYLTFIYSVPMRSEVHKDLFPLLFIIIFSFFFYHD